MRAHSKAPISLESERRNTRHQFAACRGLLGTVGTIAREEGAKALWKGLEPGMGVVAAWL